MIRKRNENYRISEVCGYRIRKDSMAIFARSAQVYHSLMHHINVESLRSCFDRLDGKKALGADQISKEIYKENISKNLEDLIARMKRMAYRPGAVRQVLIPKEGKAGATRPLGISNFEDKLVQKRVQEILESIMTPLSRPRS